MENTQSIELYLEKDAMRVAGQNYAVVSIISPDSNQRYEKIAMKIKGVFNTLDEARDHANKLHKADDTFDIHVVEMYAWIVVPPEKKALGEVHYSDQKLDELITTHTKEQELAQIEFERHRREMIEHGKKHAMEAKAREELEQKKALEQVLEDNDEPQTEEVAEELNVKLDVAGSSTAPDMILPHRQNATVDD